MKFSKPTTYSLVIGIIYNLPDLFDEDLTKKILDDLANQLIIKLDQLKCSKQVVKASLKIDHFLFKERQYKGAAKDMKKTLIKLNSILKNLSLKYNISFKAYIYQNLADFFPTNIDF